MENPAKPEVPPLQPAEIEALDRLIAIANTNTPGSAVSHGSTHQSMIVTDFLLAWWDSVNCGHFDLTSLWAVDAKTVADMQIVFGLIARAKVYPDVLGYEDKFKVIVDNWRTDRPAGKA